MTAPGLPAPGTATELYLASINDRLGQLLDRLPAAAPPPEAPRPGGEVELREPAAPPQRPTKAAVGRVGKGPGVTSGRPARTPRAPRATPQKKTATKEIGDG